MLLNDKANHIIITALFRISIIILMLGLIRCSESETIEPDPPGRRDYIWNVDTIQYQDARQTLMSEIAARGTDNVFIAGYCSGGQYGYFWHYDGQTWMPYPFHDEARLPSVGVPRRIYDNRDGSFWAVGSLISPARRGARDLVVSYEKGKWTWHNLQLPKEITAVYSTSINDAWIGGEKGYVAHFSHNKWEQDSIPITSAYGHKDIYGGIDIAVDREGETVFMTYLSHDAGGTTYYLYRGGINNWSIIDSSTNKREWGGRMWVGPDKYIYILGYNIIRMNGNEREFWFSTPDDANTRAVDGRTMNDVFMGTAIGNVYHYNGTDWWNIKEISNPAYFITNIRVFKDEVFIIGILNDTIQRTVVIHGILK